MKPRKKFYIVAESHDIDPFRKFNSLTEARNFARRRNNEDVADHYFPVLVRMFSIPAHKSSGKAKA